MIRPLSLDDVPALVDLQRRNRDHLRPWEPSRDDTWFTTDGQRIAVEQALRDRDLGLAVPFAIVADGELVGRINLSRITRGAFCSGGVGYWVDHDHWGRGVATAALAEVAAEAFGPLGLHRLEASTLLHNTASQRVLAANGFERIGLAPSYLRIDGRWQDHLLFQRIAD